MIAVCAPRPPPATAHSVTPTAALRVDGPSDTPTSPATRTAFERRTPITSALEAGRASGGGEGSTDRGPQTRERFRGSLPLSLIARTGSRDGGRRCLVATHPSELDNGGMLIEITIGLAGAIGYVGVDRLAAVPAAVRQHDAAARGCWEGLAQWARSQDHALERDLVAKYEVMRARGVHRGGAPAQSRDKATALIEERYRASSAKRSECCAKSCQPRRLAVVCSAGSDVGRSLAHDPGDRRQTRSTGPECVGRVAESRAVAGE